jgi:hypothetical protein
MSDKQWARKLWIIGLMGVLALCVWISATSAEFKGFMDDGARTWWVFDQGGKIVYCTGNQTASGAAACRMLVAGVWTDAECEGLDAAAGFIGECKPL